MWDNRALLSIKKTGSRVFDKNVFINCPFDSEFAPLRRAILFTVVYFNLNPRIAPERSDSGENRVDKIINLIQESKFGIHDLSRIISTRKNEHYRMNMPFELGMDYAIQKTQPKLQKNLLVLEKERHRYSKALSDLAGCDIEAHNDEIETIITVVRDWLVTSLFKTGDGGHKIWNKYSDFDRYLYEKAVEEDGHKDTHGISIPELIEHMRIWCKQDSTNKYWNNI